MRIRQFIVDAFVIGPFSGNPAAVCLLDEWLDDDLLQAIAAQNNLSETAFLKRDDGGLNHLRWFTPSVEVDLCGHATLATAHVLATETDELRAGDTVEFSTRSGVLRAKGGADGYELRLPVAPERAVEPAPDPVIEALSVREATVWRVGVDLLVVTEDATAVRRSSPDFAALAHVDARCVCLTAPSDIADEGDFVARVFAPRFGIDEDPATGSAQCALTPYWAERLGIERVRCRQVSARGAELIGCWSPGDRHVAVSGRCRTFSRGEIEIAS